MDDDEIKAIAEDLGKTTAKFMNHLEGFTSAMTLIKSRGMKGQPITLSSDQCKGLYWAMQTLRQRPQ